LQPASSAAANSSARRFVRFILTVCRRRRPFSTKLRGELARCESVHNALARNAASREHTKILKEALFALRQAAESAD
jgi:hypothetical protein